MIKKMLEKQNKNLTTILPQQKQHALYLRLTVGICDLWNNYQNSFSHNLFFYFFYSLQTVDVHVS